MVTEGVVLLAVAVVVVLVVVMVGVFQNIPVDQSTSRSIPTVFRSYTALSRKPCHLSTSLTTSFNQSAEAYDGWRVASLTLLRHSLGFVRTSLNTVSLPISGTSMGISQQD